MFDELALQIQEMYYQIANTAPLSFIEARLKLPFKYKHLYRPRPVINGLDESTIEVITSTAKNHISFAIWGMIPIKFEKDWHEFQQVTNTLTIRIDEKEEQLWFNENNRPKRCVIISTGFYTYDIEDGNLRRYLVQPKNKNLLLLGGIYNQLEDGFLTCSLLTKKADPIVKQKTHSFDILPIIIDEKELDLWLDDRTSDGEIDDLMRRSPSLSLKSRALSSALSHE